MMDPIEEAFREAFGDLSSLCMTSVISPDDQMDPSSTFLQQTEPIPATFPSPIIPHPLPAISTRMPSMRQSPSNAQLQASITPIPSQTETHRQTACVKAPVRRRPVRRHITIDVATSPPSAHIPNDSLSDPLSFILDAFDNLVSPQIHNPPNMPSSTLVLRRFLYRRQFSEYTFKALQSLSLPITSIDQLLPIITSSCEKCGLARA